ncbi:hypothetical protein M8J77_003197 [Diaphorina citri]|nr:hypothetical protein M8J77_003197 [Diaphorina citri]
MPIQERKSLVNKFPPWPGLEPSTCGSRVSALDHSATELGKSSSLLLNFNSQEEEEEEEKEEEKKEAEEEEEEKEEKEEKEEEEKEEEEKEEEEKEEEDKTSNRRERRKRKQTAAQPVGRSRPAHPAVFEPGNIIYTSAITPNLWTKFRVKSLIRSQDCIENSSRSSSEKVGQSYSVT